MPKKNTAAKPRTTKSDRHFEAQLRMLKTGVMQVRRAAGTVRTCHLLAEWGRSEEDPERAVITGAIARDLLELWKIGQTGVAVLESIAISKPRYRKIVKAMREPVGLDWVLPAGSPSANRFGRMADAALGKPSESSPWWSTENEEKQTTLAMALQMLKLHIVALQMEEANAFAAADV